MAVSSEPLGTYLMPLFASASWIGILTVKVNPSLTVVWPVSIIGALWALRNTLMGSNLDLGVVTMGLVALTLALDFGGVIASSRYILVVESVLVALNFLAPFLMWQAIEKALAKSKSMFWFKVFKVYLVVMAAFWCYVAFKYYSNTMQEEPAKPKS